MRDAIEATRLATLQGTISFDKNGDLTSRVISVFQIRRDTAFPPEDADRELGRPSTFGLQGVCPLSRSVAARLNGRVGRDTAVQERRQGILHGLRDALLVPRHLEAELRQTTHLGRRRAASRACRSSRLINQRVDRVPLCVSHAGMAFAADCEAVPQCVQLGDQF